MLIAVTIAAVVWLGYEIAIRRWSGRASGLELWAAALCIGSAVWIASVWAAALVHRLDRPTLLTRTLLLAAVAAALFFRRTAGRVSAATIPNEILYAYLLPALPLVAWVFFLLWRTSITPPLTHDALAYHLPRAVLWMREGGFQSLALPVDARMRLLPANYEMLLADTMLLGGGDRFTEWLAIFFFGAFVLTAGALARRWWSDTTGAVATFLLTAAVPVLLLHAGADKNDVMTSFFILSALLWGGRWLGEGDRDALLLSIVAVASAVGTKPQGLLLAVAIAPVFAWRLVTEAREKRLRGADIGVLAAVCVAGALLLGGALYGSRLMHEGAGGEQQQFVAYDDWTNLWKAPWVLVAAPFSRSVEELWVPWSDRPWFWKRDELFFSSLGIPFVVCLLLIPFTLVRFRRIESGRARERLWMSLVAAAVYVLMLPVRDVPMPHGVYVVALPRYVLFLAPVVFALTVAPAMRLIGERAARFVPAIGVVLALWFTYSAVRAVTHDRFLPLRYLSWAMTRPGTRIVPFDPRRAASVVDTVAGPHDRIAFDAGYGAWIHPAFGTGLTRPVTFIGPGEPNIPADARWVVCDRSWHIIWQHPGFTDVSQWRQQLVAGRPTPEDLRVVEHLRRDPRFELVFYNPMLNQAVFRRR